LQNKPKEVLWVHEENADGYSRGKALSINNGMGLTTTDTEAADVLCAHFQQTFTKEEFQNSVPVHIRTVDGIEISFDKLVVQKKLERLKTDKSPGPDELHPLLLQSCAVQIAEPLSIIFQKSYTAGKLPLDWKTATVTPIYKKGKRTDPSGHSLNLNKKKVRLGVAKFSFSNRVVNEWNILDEEIISGYSLAGFKRKLDRHFRGKRGYIYNFSFLPLLSSVG